MGLSVPQKYGRAIKIISWFILIIVIAINLGLSLRSLGKTHFSPQDPSKTNTGAFSDLYPRWHGGREMIFHGTNPYSERINLENQRAFYGDFDPDDGVLRDPMGFAYPATVAVPLLPFIFMPYPVALGLFGLLCVAVLAWGYIKWSQWAGLESAGPWSLLFAAAGLALHPAISTVLLRQPTIIAFGGITAAYYFLKKGNHIPAGIFLALAATKPQFALFIVLGLHLWLLRDWKTHKTALGSFWISSLAMTGFSCIFYPSWPSEWLSALVLYAHHSFGSVSIVDFWINNRFASRVLKGVIVFMFFISWRRPVDFGHRDLGALFAAGMAVGLLVLPAAHIYNHIFVFPLLAFVASRAPAPAWPVKAGAATATAGAILLWAWATLPLVLKNLPGLVQAMGLNKSMLADFNVFRMPWSPVFIAPLLVYFVAFILYPHVMLRR